MTRNKTPALKRVLSKAARTNRRIPIFVIAKTKRRITRNQSRRNWRARKIGVNAGKK